MNNRYYLNDTDITTIFECIKKISNKFLQKKLMKIFVKYLKKNKITAIKDNGEIIY